MVAWNPYATMRSASLKMACSLHSMQPELGIQGRFKAVGSLALFVIRVSVRGFHTRQHIERIARHKVKLLHNGLVMALEAKQPLLHSVIRKSIVISEPARNQ